MGLRSSAYDIPVTVETGTINTNSKILTNDIEPTVESLGGNSGLFRIWFSMTGGNSDYQISVTKLGGTDNTKPRVLNGDNNFQLISTGYYRFDIGVKPGDKINFIVVGNNVTAVNDFQVQQIQTGA